GTAPLEYQWRRDSVDLAGATNATLILASAQAGDAGVYSLRVLNGGGLAFSLPAVLQVNLPDAGALAFSAANFTVSEAAGHADIPGRGCDSAGDPLAAAQPGGRRWLVGKLQRDGQRRGAPSVSMAQRRHSPGRREWLDVHAGAGSHGRRRGLFGARFQWRRRG